MRRYTIQNDSENRCTLTLRTGEVLHFRAPPSGGYVRDETGSQWCGSLAGTGTTLHWDGRGQLADLVRSEARTASGSRQIDGMLDCAEVSQ